MVFDQGLDVDAGFLQSLSMTVIMGVTVMSSMPAISRRSRLFYVAVLVRAAEMSSKTTSQELASFYRHPGVLLSHRWGQHIS
ncbi:hypothetical protein ACG0Z6_15145 [Roseateles sp. BYS180W]|uniref:Uncharacterized protein n=2 Tax=Roseateles rivi TaxID=3299028 RepID=A0ABW7FYY7_9BURK